MFWTAANQASVSARWFWPARRNSGLFRNKGLRGQGLRGHRMARILIVDDDEAIRRLVRLNLTDLYEVFDTGQPEEALALALEHKPDAILLDLRMPGYSGFELCKTLTSFSATQLIPVFVISGEGGAKTKDFCRDLGAAAYFEKPVDFKALRDSLEQALHSRRQ